MNQIGAMRETIELARDRVVAQGGVDVTRINMLSQSLQLSHLEEMLAAMEAGDNPQKPGEGFSEGKLGRWLGWAQAACVAMGLFTLEDMKRINKSWSD